MNLFFSFKVRLLIVSSKLALMFGVAFLGATSDFTFRLAAWYYAVTPLSAWLRGFVIVLTRPRVDVRALIAHLEREVLTDAHLYFIIEFFVEWYLFPGEF